MTVPPYDATTVQLLRSAIVSVGRVREHSRRQVVDVQGDGERGVGRNGVKVLRGAEFGGRLPVKCEGDSPMSGEKAYHLINGRDIAHRSRVAGTTLNLLTIREGLSDTEVDEVIPGEC